MPLIDGELVPLVYERWADEFGKVEWGTVFDQSFQIGGQIDALLREAAAKGMTVVVQVALVPTEKIFPPKPAEEEEGHTEDFDETAPEKPAT